MLNQSKTESQHAILQILWLHVWCQRAYMALLFQLCCIWYTSVSWTGSTMQLFLVDISGLWPSNILGDHTQSRLHFSQFHAVASWGLHTRTALLDTWPRQCCVNMEADFITLLFMHPSWKPEPHGWHCPVWPTQGEPGTLKAQPWDAPPPIRPQHPKQFY